MCSVEGCEGQVYSKGFCHKHYQRQHRYGNLDERPKARLPLEQRFWNKVNKQGNCWIWTGAKQPTGYGYIGAGGRNCGRVMAHRWSYEQAKGPIPNSMYVLHSCDNPSCVNPAHLRVGTPLDNTNDAIARGRLVNPPVMSGEANMKAKLTLDQVKIIRASPHIKASVFARAFGISHSSVSRVKLGKSWKE